MFYKYMITILFLVLFATVSAAVENVVGLTAEVQEAANAAPVASVDAPVRPYPCENDAQFGEFDFWVGEWNVHTANGDLAGHNSISAQQHGCVLIENWTSTTGGTGTSINYLDRTSDEWVQIWNDANGSQINIRGGMTEEGMLLKGTIHYIGNQTTMVFRGLWTALPDGRVRQFFEQSSDTGETWEPWFEGFYSRRGDNNEL